MSTSTCVLLWNVGSSTKYDAIFSHHAPCSGRSLFCCAASSDSNRTSAMRVPSSVTPPVLPSHPIAPGATSETHLSRCARTCAASETFPWITCTNMSNSPLQPRAAVERLLFDVTPSAAGGEPPN